MEILIYRVLPIPVDVLLSANPIFVHAIFDRDVLTSGVGHTMIVYRVTGVHENGKAQLNLSRWVLQEAATSFPVIKVGYGAGARLLSCPPSN